LPTPYLKANLEKNEGKIMNDNEQKKRIIRARLIRLPIFLGIVFLFAWMFRWDIGNTVIEVGSTTTPDGGYTKLDRWTGATYHCAFRITSRESSSRAVCLPAPTPLDIYN
jgi:hypothetical protein